MKQRVISLTLVFVMMLTFFAIKPIMDNDHVARAEEYRNGYSLTPTKYDGTGIDTKSSFILKSKEEVTIDTIKDNLSINPTIDYEIEKLQDGFLIKPNADLNMHALYTFTLMDTTWSFQTMSSFKVVGTLPANESSNVPINTGIEMTFNYEGAKVKEFFQIQPEVSGTFEAHGKTVVFVPKGLKEKTIYTVTLKAGLTLADSNQKLIEDYTFSFETGQDKEEPYIEPKGYFNFNNIINEFGLEETPSIPMTYSIYDSNSEANIKATIYAYSSIEAFAKAIEDYNNAPFWSIYGMENNRIKTEKLSKALSFEQPISQEYANQQFLQLPEKLNAGYYLVDCTWEDIHFQTLIQVTNMSYYFVDSTTKNLLWINDLGTKKPIINAVVKEKGDTKIYKSDAKGIVELPSNKEDKDISIYYIKSGDQSALVLNQMPHYKYWGNDSTRDYWRYIQTDRNLYMPKDTVKLWGFVKNRYEEEKIDSVTIEINAMNWYFYDMWNGYGNDVPYVSKALKVDRGFYNGALELPNLEPGSYQVEVKHKDQLISSTYIQVEEYVKPEYKIEVSSNKKAIFANESVIFTTKTAFFEGTPVSNIKVNYNIQGLDYIEGELQSDLNGEAKINYLAPYMSGYQGQTYVNFNAYATLPESGQIFTDHDLRVFINNINVKLNTTYENGKGTITAEVNKIVLDKLNDSDTENDEDYLGEPISGHQINGTIYKNEWKKRETGEYYDYINKIIVTQYEYYTEKTKIQDIVIKTDQSGKGTAEINFLKDNNSYYTAELSTVDLAGNKMTFDQYFGESWYYSPDSMDRYYLKSDKETFNLGEEVQVKFMHKEEVLKDGSFLYITAQNGIKAYKTSESATYDTTFNEDFFPNADVLGIYFNGKTYVKSEYFSPRLDIENNRITFSATTDQSSYKPGEVVKVNLKATIYSNEEKKTVGAKGVMINISIVDEALFALSDQNINTLESLYEWVPNGINFEYASHKNEGYGFGVPILYGKGIREEVAYDTAEMATAKTMNDGTVSGNVRSEFKDTAYFSSVKLDENGQGTFTFTLPDNVTSWRMTFAGISETLKAGTNTQELVVTLPYFINHSLSDTFLEGDKPFVGVSTYGSGLKQGDTINYEIICKENDYKITASGVAFNRTNIPLFEMKEGTYTLIIKSISNSGYSDAIEKQIRVYKTYHQKEKAVFYQLVNGLTLTTNESGMTGITFVDEGRGRFMPELYNLAYSGGKRIDQKYIASQARTLLAEYFDVSFDFNEDVSLTDYQMDDGGFGILPYAESDLETTVKILPLIKDSINSKTIITYLDYMYQNVDNENKAMTLYGLALMDAPIILELEKVEKINNLSLKERLYLSMAYAVVGDEYKAETIYKESIEPLLEKYEEKVRVKIGDTEDSYLEYSSLTMVLASYLDLDIKDALYQYVKAQYSKEILVNSELLTYIKTEIQKVKSENLVIDYQYDGKAYNIKIENGWPQTITIPSSKMKDFNVTQVAGKGALVATYNDQFLSNINNDTNLSASRKYYNYYSGAETKTFKQSDIVKVKIDWNIDKNAIDNGYILTDYVPSGLKPIENVWDLGLKTDDHYWYRDIDGQRVTFYIYETEEESKPLYYYARVVAPGNYKAEGLLIQGTTVKDSLWLGEKDSINIQN